MKNKFPLQYHFLTNFDTFYMSDQDDRAIYIDSSSEESSEEKAMIAEEPIYISSSSSAEEQEEEEENEKETTFYKVRVNVPRYKSPREEAEEIYYSWKASRLTLDEMEAIIEDYRAYEPKE